MTLYDYLADLDNQIELTDVLIQLDKILEYLHNKGLCIYNFEPKKIVLYNNKLTFDSFKGLLSKLNIVKNAKQINILQLCKIGLFAYNKMPIDGNMNNNHYKLLQTHLQEFNKLGQIPENIYKYYQDVFLNNNITYLNDYLIKNQEQGNQHSNSLRKVKTTSIGTAFANNETASVNILFIPTILTLVYILSLILFTIWR